MVSVQDVRNEVATALRTLGREKEWDVDALKYGETPKWSGNNSRISDGPEKPALADSRTPEAQVRSLETSARTEPTLDSSSREVGKLEASGRTEPTLDSPGNDPTKDTAREDASSSSKERTSEREEPQRTEAQEKIRSEDQRQATFAREMTR